jgi:hypothetical protein
MYKTLASLILMMFPALAGAQGIANSADAGPFQDLLENILIFSNDVLIPFILGIGFLVLVWGIFKYFIFGGANDESKEQGKSLIIYATLGFVLIIVFWGIVNLLTQSTGLVDQSLQNIPSIQGQ